jgi:hypothetical protein
LGRRDAVVRKLGNLEPLLLRADYIFIKEEDSPREFYPGL